MFPKCSTLELKHKEFGPKVKLLRESSCLEPASKVWKPIYVFEQYLLNDFWLFLRSLSCTGSSGRLVGKKSPKFHLNPGKPLPIQSEHVPKT